MAGQDIGIARGWEFVHETFLAAHAFVDAEGRPLGELNAPGDCLRDVPVEVRQCKYHGSRYLHTKPMNVSALRQMTDHWDEIKGGVRFLRRSYLHHFGVAELTHQHTWRLAKIATTLPVYLLCRPDDPVADGELPVVTAGMFKVLAGVFQTVQHLLLVGAALGVIPQEAPSPDSLLAYAERNELLIGNAGVCAGPPQKILEVLQVLLRDSEPSDSIAERSVPALVGDPLPFFRYALADAALQVRKFIFGLEWRAQLFQLRERLANASAEETVLSAISGHLQAALSDTPVPLPEFLLSAGGDAVRGRITGLLAAEVDDMTRWLAAHGVDTSLPSDDLAAWKGRAQAFAREHRGASSPTAPMIGEALVDYLALERALVGELVARQAGIDGLLERGGEPLAVDEQALARAFGATPRDLLAGLAGVRLPG